MCRLPLRQGPTRRHPLPALLKTVSDLFLYTQMWMTPSQIIMRISPVISLTASASILLIVIALTLRVYRRVELADRVALVACIISFSFLTALYVVASFYVVDMRIPFLVVAIPVLIPVLLQQVVKLYQSVKKKKDPNDCDG